LNQTGCSRRGLVGSRTTLLGNNSTRLRFSLRRECATEHIEISDTGIRASRIGLGTWAIGGLEWGGADDDESIATIQQALEFGITLIDTAPIYGNGHSEEVVGRALSGRRDSAIVATKVGLEWDEHGVVHRNSSRTRIEKEIEDSLRRLQTDYIDIYQIHWPDLETPIEDTARTMQRLLESGKIRAIGVSNFSPEQMDCFRQVAPLHTVQPPYNLFERAAEREVLPYAGSHGITGITYGALCRGLLSGRMREDTQFVGDDMRRTEPKFQQPYYGDYLRAAKRLDDLAHQRFGNRIINLAIRWVLDQPGVGVALWGARHPQQLNAVPQAFDFKMDVETQRQIDQILTEEIKHPIGPEFMAPPETANA
jgi:aryl-alcohol dehydrogenase-like predicted oxidoreductase